MVRPGGAAVAVQRLVRVRKAPRPSDEPAESLGGLRLGGEGIQRLACLGRGGSRTAAAGAQRRPMDGGLAVGRRQRVIRNHASWQGSCSVARLALDEIVCDGDVRVRGGFGATDGVALDVRPAHCVCREAEQLRSAKWSDGQGLAVGRRRRAVGGRKLHRRAAGVGAGRRR